MRCQYREKYYECGNYLEVNLYPVYRKSGHRRKKSKPTKDVMKRLNQINAENKLIRIINANFTPDDLQFNLSYTDQFHPKTDDEAAKELRNFLRRLKNYRKKLGLSELKYIAVTEKGSRNGRYHHHLIVNGGLSLKELSAIWGRGYTHAFPLQFDETGIIGLSKYLVKDPVCSKKRWNSSKNLVHPPAKIRDGRLSKRRVQELARDTDNAREFEKYYDGYYFAEAHKLINDVNGGVYIHARFYKKEANLQCRRKLLTPRV